MTLTHLSIGHRGLPLAEQIFRFAFSDGTVRHYRYVYQGASGESSLVVPLDMENLQSYASTVLYDRFDGLGPPPRPTSLQLAQNVPNPFNPTTEITFSLDRAGEAGLSVFNLAGARVATLVDGPLSGGSHTVSFDGSRLSSGVYIYTLQMDGRTEARKMLLVR